MKFSVFQVSRKGGREKNEDRMGYCYTREAGLFVLADGMGGHPDGEVAAQLALQILSARFQREAQPVVGDAEVHHVALADEAERPGVRRRPVAEVQARVVRRGQEASLHDRVEAAHLLAEGQHVVARVAVAARHLPGR